MYVHIFSCDNWLPSVVTVHNTYDKQTFHNCIAVLMRLHLDRTPSFLDCLFLLLLLFLHNY